MSSRFSTLTVRVSLIVENTLHVLVKMLLLKVSTVLNFDLCGPEKSEEN